MSPPATLNAKGKLLAAYTATGPMGRSIRRRSGRGPMGQAGSAWSIVACRNEPSRRTSAKSRSWKVVRFSSPCNRSSPRWVSSAASGTSSSAAASSRVATCSSQAARSEGREPTSTRAASAAAPISRSSSSGGVSPGSCPTCWRTVMLAPGRDPGRRCRPARSMGLPGDHRSGRADKEVQVGAGVGLLHVVDIEALPTTLGGGECPGQTTAPRCGGPAPPPVRPAAASGAVRRARSGRRPGRGRAGHRPPPQARRAAPPCRTPCRSSARRTPAPCRVRPARASFAAAAGSLPRACPDTPSGRSRGAPAPSPA